MKTNTRTISGGAIALLSAVALAITGAVPANAVNSPIYQQLCGGPLDAQVHTVTTGYTTIYDGVYGTTTLSALWLLSSGGNHTKFLRSQSAAWKVNATTISTSTSTCA